MATTQQSATLPRAELSSRLVPSRLRVAPLAITGGAALAIALVLAGTSSNGIAHFWHVYLVAATYCTTISLGALFFVLLHHLTHAGWSVAVRRVAELIAAPLPFLALFYVPILLALLLGNSELYVWNDTQHVAADELLQGKAAYLNAPFFLARSLFYFGVWWVLTRCFITASLRQDREANVAATLQMQSFSGPAMMAYAVTVCFAGFDWLMSLEPHWYSSIYGIYFFSGAVVGFFAAINLIVIFLEWCGPLRGVLRTEHLHDLGKFLFGFSFFWVYIGFSQYLLIWYANIPEETVWYQVRQAGGWQWVTIFLFAGHFFLPFFGLMSRQAKRNRATLAVWSLWLLAMHGVDLYWLVMPGFSPTHVPICWLDLVVLFGVTAMYLALMFRLSQNRPLLPIGDPRLHESL